MNFILLNKIIYFIFIVIITSPWLAFLIGALLWLYAYQADNADKKHLSVKIILISLLSIYITRFAPLLVYSAIANRHYVLVTASQGIDDFLTLFQILLIAGVWKFCEIQAYIFVYQRWITENVKKSSSRKIREYLLTGIGLTLIGVVVLEMLKSMI